MLNNILRGDEKSYFYKRRYMHHFLTNLVLNECYNQITLIVVIYNNFHDYLIFSHSKVLKTISVSFSRRYYTIIIECYNLYNYSSHHRLKSCSALL